MNECLRPWPANSSTEIGIEDFFIFWFRRLVRSRSYCDWLSPSTDGLPPSLLLCVHSSPLVLLKVLISDQLTWISVICRTPCNVCGKFSRLQIFWAWDRVVLFARLGSEDLPSKENLTMDNDSSTSSVPINDRVFDASYKKAGTSTIVSTCHRLALQLTKMLESVFLLWTRGGLLKLVYNNLSFILS